MPLTFCLVLKYIAIYGEEVGGVFNIRTPKAVDFCEVTAKKLKL